MQQQSSAFIHCHGCIPDSWDKLFCDNLSSLDGLYKQLKIRKNQQLMN